MARPLLDGRRRLRRHDDPARRGRRRPGRVHPGHVPRRGGAERRGSGYRPDGACSAPWRSAIPTDATTGPPRSTGLDCRRLGASTEGVGADSHQTRSTCQNCGAPASTPRRSATRRRLLTWHLRRSPILSPILVGCTQTLPESVTIPVAHPAPEARCSDRGRQNPPPVRTTAIRAHILSLVARRGCSDSARTFRSPSSASGRCGPTGHRSSTAATAGIRSSSSGSSTGRRRQ